MVWKFWREIFELDFSGSARVEPGWLIQGVLQVMMATSVWCLIAPAFEAAEHEGYYGELKWVPVVIGFLLGGFFVLGSSKCMPCLVSNAREKR